MIATKIAMKIPFDAILDDIHIESSFNLHSVAQRHQ